MSAQGVLTPSAYHTLVNDLRHVIEQGKARAEQAAGQELVKTYWEVGRRIQEAQLTERAGYGTSLLQEVALELGIHYTTLTRAVLFFEQNKNIEPWLKNLKWAHHELLVAISDGAERAFYEQETAARSWTKRELKRAIQQELYADPESDRKKGLIHQLTRPTAASYLYRVEVRRVIDGDTLIAMVDLGFEVWREQRIRLAHIDCPPLTEPEGKTAFHYVRDALALAEGIVLRTSQLDIHGRYVADLFYHTREDDKLRVFRQGRYLNQELLNHGLATLL